MSVVPLEKVRSWATMKRLLFISMLFPLAGYTADDCYTLTIKDHRFHPSELSIPAGEKVRILIVNHDATTEEFESYALNREKVIDVNSSTVIFIGPLTPGRYEFSGEFHTATAQGAIVVK
jgi:plastocyanin